MLLGVVWGCAEWGCVGLEGEWFGRKYYGYECCEGVGIVGCVDEEKE